MFRFTCKNLLLIQNLYKFQGSTTNHARLLQTQSLKPNTNIPNQYSPTISYLINSCGFSLDSALSASNKIHIETTEKPDSVLHLLKTHGFTPTQITNLITKNPSLILSDPEKTLQPKIHFFQALGFSEPGLQALLLMNGNILHYSLAKRIIPTVEFLKRFLHSNESVALALKRCSWVFSNNFQTCTEPNISTLKDHGVPDENISKVFLYFARAFTLRNDLFTEAVKLIDEMGFDPKSGKYLYAVITLVGTSKSNWDNKVEALRSFGWSKEDTLLAFRRQPMFMLSSEKKIRIMMDFFVNRLGIKPADLLKCPTIIGLSLEKTIIPRCSVYQVLLSKGLVDSDMKLIWVFNLNKKVFEKKFVTKYLETAPELVEVYKGEMGCPSFETLRSFVLR